MKSRGKRKPTGAAATQAALIDAFLRLVARRSVASVSVRDVAAAAGVNHGLVHRHFGSKDGLVRAAVAHLTSLAYDEDRAGLTARSFAVLREHPELPIVVARCCLDGPADLLDRAAPPPERMAALVEPMRALLARLGVGTDAHVVNGLGTAALLGWFVFRPLLARGYGLPADADAQVAELVASLDRLLGAAAV
jgi:AcrR family transcriptional regulator